MKLQSFRAASLVAIMLLSPFVTLAKGNSKLRRSDAGNGGASGVNTLHLRKAVETLKRENQPTLSPKRSDSAFRK
jgi:hypothetical protein